MYLWLTFVYIFGISSKKYTLILNFTSVIKNIKSENDIVSFLIQSII